VTGRPHQRLSQERPKAPGRLRLGPMWLSLAWRTAAITTATASANHDGSLLRSADTVVWNDIPKNGVPREQTKEMSKPARARRKSPRTE
jgi:hypothetical protein